jgi:8-oxoguanine deaminase
MKTRIDNATVITCRPTEPVVLEDTSIAFENGVITYLGPTADLAGPSQVSFPKTPPISELRGRPLGAILVKMGVLTREQLLKALEIQKVRHGVIGHTLVECGYVAEGAIQWAMAAQAGHELAHAHGSDLQIIDGRGKLVIPGLINTHHHLYQSLTRCMPAVQNATLFEWLTALYPRWREMTYDTLRQAATISIAELLLGGCTTTSDHQYLFPQGRDVRLETVLDAAEMLGIRIHACRGSMSLGVSQGGLPPDACTQSEDAILADCARVIEHHHDARPMAMRRIDLAPCSPFSVTPQLLEQTRALAAERGVLLHTHAAETLDEERFCIERFGVRPIEYLRQCGWLGENVYLAHCVHLNAEEVELLARTGTGVAHCPCSNMRLGSGIPPIRAMLDAGVKVGIGVDGSSSNDGGNLLAEVRQSLLLQRVALGPKGMTTAEAFRVGTIGGASVLHRPELGRLDVGLAADLVMYDAGDIAFAGAFAQDPLGAIMLCNAPRPDRVIVAGKAVVDAGHVVGVDWPHFVADFNAMVRRQFS